MTAAWRVLKAKHQKTGFTGEGARIYGGRWNPIGIPVIYTAESLSLATLEIIVHLEREELLRQRFVKIPVTFDTNLVLTLSRRKLPKNWNQLPPSEATQRIGHEWVLQAESSVFTTVKNRKKEIGVGLLHAMLDQLGLTIEDIS